MVVGRDDDRDIDALRVDVADERPLVALRRGCGEDDTRDGRRGRDEFRACRGRGADVTDARHHVERRQRRVERGNELVVVTHADHAGRR